MGFIRRRKILLLAIGLILAILGWWLASWSYSGPSVTPELLPPALREDLVVTLLDNGLQVVLAPIANRSTVTISVWVGAGSVHDPPHLSGLAHFFEHLVFQQSDHHSGIDDEELAALGGSVYAFTARDSTSYFVTVPTEHLTAGIEWVTDNVIHGDLPEDRLPVEREVVLRETDEQDDHDVLLYDTVFAQVYGLHPYAQPEIGTRATIAAITHNDFLAWRSTYYVPNNMTIVVTGRFETAATLDRIEALLGGLEARPLPPFLPSDPVRPTASRRVYLRHEGESDKLAMAWTGPRATDFDDVVALDLLQDILTLAEFNVHEFRKNLSTPHNRFRIHGPSVFTHAVTATPGTTPHLRTGMLLRIRAVRSGLINRRTFSLAKTARLAQMALEHQSSHTIANSLGYFATVAGDPLRLFDYVDGLRRVRIMDLMRAARKYLDPGVRLEVSLVNDPSEDRRSHPLLTAAHGLFRYVRWDLTDDLTAAIRRLGKRLGAQRPKPAAPANRSEIVRGRELLTLENGVRVILRANPSTHIVVVQAMVAAGSAEESSQHAGLSQFTSRFLLRGTETRSARRVMEQVAKTGALLDWRSDDDTAGLELSHVKQFYARYFVPENMVLVAVGNFDPGVMYERLNIRLGALPSATGAAPGGAPSRRASSLPVGIPASKTLRQVRAGVDRDRIPGTGWFPRRSCRHAGVEHSHRWRLVQPSLFRDQGSAGPSIHRRILLRAACGRQLSGYLCRSPTPGCRRHRRRHAGDRCRSSSRRSYTARARSGKDGPARRLGS